MKVQYKLLGQPVNPVNRREIYLEVNHDQESVINQPLPHVGISNLYFALEDIEKIMNYLSNPPGVTEGVPFDIEITERGQTEVINMYLDLMKGFERSNDGISATVKMLHSLDWVDDKADGFTLESMYNQTGVTPFRIDGILYQSFQQFFDDRCVYIPYVISTIPDTHSAFMALITLIFICIQIYRAIKDIVEAAEYYPQLILEIPFVIALIFTMLTLIEQMVNFLIQPLKYHGAMLMVDMLKIVCMKMGLTFNSSPWETYPLNTVVYMPQKYAAPVTDIPKWTLMQGYSLGNIGSQTIREKKIGGYTSPAYAPLTAHDSNTPHIQHGYLNGTGGDVFREAKRFCNGKIIIEDQTTQLILERRDFAPATSSFQIPDIRQDWATWNLDELSANIIIRFARDLNDKNIDDNYLGTIFQATHEQIYTNDTRLVCLKGVREIKNNTARGVRKKDFTYVENTVLDIIKFMNDNLPAMLVLMHIGVTTANGFIFSLNGLILLINTLIITLLTIINTINNIISVVNTLGGNITPINTQNFQPIALVPFVQPILPSQFPTTAVIDSRIGALMLENDFVDVPKLLMVDMTRPEFQGGKRIAFIHPDNENVINAKYQWDNFYFIDAFVGAINNRYTKISPALNKDSENNPILFTVQDFKNNVSNPKIKDNFGEDIITDSIQWRVGDESGIANIMYRKKGWLKNPQSQNGLKRSEEININLQLKTSLPNGQ